MSIQRGTRLIEYDWKTLGDNDFEELCKDLLLEADVAAERKSGPGSGDMGCDIIAVEKIALKIGALRAKTLNCDRLLIITSHDLSAQARDTCAKISIDSRYDVKVSYWIEADLVGRLLKSPVLSEKYFGAFPHSKKIKFQTECSGFSFVPAKIYYNNKEIEVKLFLNLTSERSSIPQCVAEQIGADIITPPIEKSIGTFLSVEKGIVKNIEIVFELFGEPKEPYKLKLEEVHVSKEWFSITTMLYGVLGLDVLKNFGISFKERMLYPE
jgi:hypothetical protein